MRLVTRGLGTIALVTRGLSSGRTVAPNPPAHGQSLYEALCLYLKGCPSLASLTGVYFIRPEKGGGGNYPYLIVGPLGSPVEMNLGGDMDCPEIGFSVHSQDDGEAWTLGRAAYKCLKPRGNPKLTFDDGTETTRVPIVRDRMREQPARGPNNKNVWVYSFSYRWMVSNSDSQ